MVSGLPVTSDAFIKPIQSQSLKPVSAGEAHGAFASSLKQAINAVNDAQIASDAKTKALARGEVDDLHDVMIASQKASITMQTTIEIRNKVIDAYKEMMRMQV
ncbi:flagellar hook-basal body complex protein FliE [Halobacillus naozhouensis]|uniref:Flagellar hook-basal body complex protein FliE n=1 Tax=Halobacillus naozhouensis TaxID=554880 RepID=A0ABY8J5L6_9BACI|nr:flagellar hook-basal body complex protein FliE [Halobacillus naozhouensis]WFT76734.1 flagellar hook-basal body complex protein FliE [Halobacillus naozhouensis]